MSSRSAGYGAKGGGGGDEKNPKDNIGSLSPLKQSAKGLLCVLRVLRALCVRLRCGVVCGRGVHAVLVLARCFVRPALRTLLSL